MKDLNIIFGDRGKFKIEELIHNIHYYGNSKLYMKSPSQVMKYPNKNHVIKLSVGENGELLTNYKIECFDVPYWDGEKVNKDATLEETIDLNKSANLENAARTVATVLWYSLFQGYDKTYLTFDGAFKINRNYARASEIIGQIANEMLELSNKELACLIMNHWDEECTENILLSKITEETLLKNDMPIESSIDSINQKITDVLERLYCGNKIWKAIQNSKTIEESNLHGEEWRNWCQEEQEVKVPRM